MFIIILLFLSGQFMGLPECQLTKNRGSFTGLNPHGDEMGM